jgi:hypothetical protein
MNLSKETKVLIHTKINVEEEKMISCMLILLAHIIMKNKLILKHLLKISKKDIENIKSLFNSSFNIYKEIPPDGVLVWNTWCEEEERIGQRGMEPCDELVPSPATPIPH